MKGDGSFVDMLLGSDSCRCGNAAGGKYALTRFSERPVVTGVKARASLSRRLSPVRLGGGGEGGLEPGRRGDRGGGTPCVGVSGRLDAALEGFEEVNGWDMAVEGSRNGDWSPRIVCCRLG